MKKHPIWEPISRGKSLGFMKLASGGVWRARRAVEGGKHVNIELGKAETVKDDGFMTHSEAMEQAMKWFSMSEGTNTKYTVRECIADYVEKLRLHNSDDAAKRTEQRINKHVPADIQRTLVKDLSVNKITKWRDGMVKQGDDETMRKSKDSANRTLAMFKAALNYAYDREITADPRWNKVKGFAGVTKGKVLLLTDEQITTLLRATEGGFHNLCMVAVLTGARYGELREAKVQDFNAKSGTLTLRTRKGRGGVVREREAMLSDEAVTFLKQITKPFGNRCQAVSLVYLSFWPSQMGRQDSNTSPVQN